MAVDGNWPEIQISAESAAFLKTFLFERQYRSKFHGADFHQPIPGSLRAEIRKKLKFVKSEQDRAVVKVEFLRVEYGNDVHDCMQVSFSSAAVLTAARLVRDGGAGSFDRAWARLGLSPSARPIPLVPTRREPRA